MPSILIKARSALAFPSSKPGTQFRASLPYVPGGVLVGAIGRIAAESQWHDSALFRNLICRNAYPAQKDDRWVRPLPLTARRPKGDSDASPFDTLIARLCLEQLQPAGLPPGLARDDAAEGFYTIRDNEIQTRDVTQRVLTRVAINRRRGTAEDQRLYSPLVINEAQFDCQAEALRPTRFLGSLELPPDLPVQPATLLAAIEHLGQSPEQWSRRGSCVLGRQQRRRHRCDR
ncbi:MAG: hypothetical protein HC822_26965 [Oscillochloris sp.]|nr:hypothetical protein [Oscillochloris sp.]